MPRPRKTVIKDEEWARVQPEIRRLYLVEDKSLKDVMMILSAFRDFRPSKAQLEWKLKQWHMTKNMTSTEWKHVIRRVRKRHFEGKDSKIYLSGIPLRLATVEKARSRHCYETTIEKTMRVNTPPPPDYLSLIIRTPSPQMVTNICNMHNIPWLLAKDFFKGMSP
ncbi:hypothetical protein EsH8_IX_001000 [Colletotrichum jinshuiense]